MNFQYIKQVPRPQILLDKGFSRTSKKKDLKIDLLSAIDKTQAKLSSEIMKIHDDFPSFNNLPDFYKELSEIMLDMDKTRKALSKLNWASGQVSKISRDYKKLISKMYEDNQLLSKKKSYYGRLSSIVHRLKNPLDVLEQTRRIMRDFPAIKDIPTVCIAGFPNVGKSTLLSKISSSTPEIKAYAFTTKKLNTGYFSHRLREYQLIDTPGTLARYDKMNLIEKQAYLAIKELSNLVLFVFDPTETYPLDDQKKLFEKVKGFGIPMRVYVSKTDIISDEDLKKFLIEINVKALISTAEVKKEIISYFENLRKK